MPRPDRNPWTHEQIATMRRMREDGCSFEEIADVVNHPVKSCYNKAYTLGIRSPVGRARRIDVGAARLEKRKKFLKECRTPASEMRTRSTLRPCLCCRNDFPSQGPHNRLCPKCWRENDDTVFTTPAVVMR